MSNQWCDTCGGLVDRIGLRPQGVRFCECRETIEKLRAKLAAERERADYAWKNTRLIDADCQRVTEERDGLRAELAALRAENEALRDDCSRLASYNAEESAHLRTRAEEAEADLAALRAERDTWKGIAGEYSDCLQDLCMTRLYDICRPVSHSWPGQKHVLSIRQAVDFLLERAEKAEANYRFMVERAADEKLDGYRELGSKCAALEERAEKAEAERDDALVAVKAMHKLLDRDWAIVDRDITLRCESHDQAWNYLHEMRDLVRAALENVVPYKEPQP